MTHPVVGGNLHLVKTKCQTQKRPINRNNRFSSGWWEVWPARAAAKAHRHRTHSRKLSSMTVKSTTRLSVLRRPSTRHLAVRPMLAPGGKSGPDPSPAQPSADRPGTSAFFASSRLLTLMGFRADVDTAMLFHLYWFVAFYFSSLSSSSNKVTDSGEWAMMAARRMTSETGAGVVQPCSSLAEFRERSSRAVRAGSQLSIDPTQPGSLMPSTSTSCHHPSIHPRPPHSPPSASPASASVSASLSPLALAMDTRNAADASADLAQVPSSLPPVLQTLVILLAINLLMFLMASNDPIHATDDSVSSIIDGRAYMIWPFIFNVKVAASVEYLFHFRHLTRLSRLSSRSVDSKFRPFDISWLWYTKTTSSLTEFVKNAFCGFGCQRCQVSLALFLSL